MNSLVPMVAIVVVFIALLLVLIFSKFYVVAAFTLSAVITPFFFLFASELYLYLSKNSEGINYADIREIGFLYAILGIPIFLVFMLPVYHSLKTGSMPLMLTFPVAVIVILLIGAHVIATKPLDYIFHLAVIVCGTFHSLLILGLISVFIRMGGAK